jgi:membrane-associated protease RseP (regulator of RpoE activity)
MEPLQAAILAIVASVVSLVVGFGVLNNEVAGIITAAAGTLIPAIFVIVNSAERTAAIKAGRAVKGISRI